jgi:hypothetical protein
MLFSRLLIPRIRFGFLFRLKSTDINSIDKLNQIQTKDFMKIFYKQQTKWVFQ